MNAESTNPNVAVRNRQYALIAGGIAVVALGGFLLYTFIGGTPEAARAVAEINKPVKLQISKPADVSDKEAWRSFQESSNKKFQNDLAEISKTNQTLKASLEAAAKNQETTDKNLRAVTEQLAAIKSAAPVSGQSSGANPSAPRAPNLKGLDEPLPRIEQGAVLRRPGSINESVSFRSPNGVAAPPSQNTNANALQGSASAMNANFKATPEVEIIRFSKAESQDEPSSSSAASPSESDNRNRGNDRRTKVGKGTFIPANTFVRVVQLNGVLAPVSGQGQGTAGNAHPIIFEVVDPANLPNFRKLNIKGCRFLAAGTGDLSSERVYARMETFTCVKHDGEAVEMPVKGHVVGEDGNVGIAGTLVSKAGRVIAAQIAAEFAKGVGSGFKAFATSQTSTAAGITQTIDPSRYGQAALGSGIAGGSDALANYYIKLSSQLFPVVEVPGGRIVEIAVTVGVDFPGNLSQLDNVSFSDKRAVRHDHD
jgi:conjugal transfer pilus assembly protein TraB